MRRAIGIGLLVGALAGCGSTSLHGALEWTGITIHSRLGDVHAVNGHVRNATAHVINLHPADMRLLDDRGNEVNGRIRVGRTHLAAHAITSLSARWRSGKPVLIDYGAGTLRLNSG